MPEVEEHHSSGVAKAGLVTGIVGATGTALELLRGNGLFGGGQNQQMQEKINALRDENILLKAGKDTDEKVNSLQLQVVELKGEVKALRSEVGQAFNAERQYIDDNFVKAKKCVAAQDITPAVGLWPFNTPSFAPYPPPFVPYPPFPPFTPPAVNNGGTATQTGSGSNTNGQ